MKISIVVPTRNGSPYLRSCLESCIADKGDDVEIIVSDNNSSDDTSDIVAGISDSRLKYFNTGKSLSMRQNYEFALGKTSGDYLIFIGDDDAILKSGIETLRYLIKKFQPDVINWLPVDYKWPSGQDASNGLLKIRANETFGPLLEKDAAKILDDFFAGRTFRYKNGANLYHGCVAARTVRAVQKKTGEYFQAHCPDVYASLANLIEAKYFLSVGHPITIGGESKKSTGFALLTNKMVSSDQNSLAGNFIDLAESDPVRLELDLRIRSLVACTYANLHRVNSIFFNNARIINHEAWRSRIILDIGALLPQERADKIALAEDLFSTIDPQYLRDKEKWIFSASQHKSLIEKIRYRFPANRQIKRKNLATVADAAMWIEDATAATYRPFSMNKSQKFHRLPTMMRLWRN